MLHGHMQIKFGTKHILCLLLIYEYRPCLFNNVNSIAVEVGVCPSIFKWYMGYQILTIKYAHDNRLVRICDCNCNPLRPTSCPVLLLLIIRCHSFITLNARRILVVLLTKTLLNNNQPLHLDVTSFHYGQTLLLQQKIRRSCFVLLTLLWRGCHNAYPRVQLL